MEQLSLAARNKMAAIYGLVVGIYYLIITTITNMNVANFTIFYATKVIGYIVFFILMGILTARIKKANGGYLEFRKAFGAIIIMVLITGLIYAVYNYTYIEYIDKGFAVKYKASILAFMEHTIKANDDALNKTAAQMDKQIEESKTFNLGNNIMSFFSGVLLDSLLGLLVGLAVKKNPPVIQ